MSSISNIKLNELYEEARKTDAHLTRLSFIKGFRAGLKFRKKSRVWPTKVAKQVDESVDWKKEHDRLKKSYDLLKLHPLVQKAVPNLLKQLV